MNALEAIMFFSGVLVGMGIVLGVMAIGVWYLIKYKGI